MTNGVLYQLTGPKAAEVMCVSLYSLRGRYAGPICILATDDSRDICETIARKVSGIEVLPTETITTDRKRHATAKAWTYLLSPFDRTIYLDVDTLVIKPIDDLFASADGTILTQLGHYRLMDNGVAARLRKIMNGWERLGPGMRMLWREACAANPPLIQAGVVAFGQRREALWEAHHLAVAGRGSIGLHDQYALQTIVHKHVGRSLYVVDDRWNCSTKYGIDRGRAHILHFHKHRWLGEHADLWRPWYNEAVARNFGGLAEWTGTFEPEIFTFLA